MMAYGRTIPEGSDGDEVWIRTAHHIAIDQLDTKLDGGRIRYSSD